MRIALICSNAHSITKQTKKGTEIFITILIKHLKEYEDIKFTAFVSEDSEIPFAKSSLNFPASSTDEQIPHDKHILFELALISKAMLQHKEFDLYHVNIGDGDIVLPFAGFVKTPIIITVHHVFDKEYVYRYFTLFKNLEHVYFVSISDSVRKSFPEINFIKTVYNGIDVDDFYFDKNGGEDMIWAGRGIPSKGLHSAIDLVRKSERKLLACIVRKPEALLWLNECLENTNELQRNKKLIINFDLVREKLITKFQKSKLFLFPIEWEEPFGLVLIESMACGTPVVAYARGSVPEIVIDGVNGFLVNPSDDDIRGNFVIKETGIEGLAKAVEKIYSLSHKEYLKMRGSCRMRVVKKFTADNMAKSYVDLYNRVIAE